MIKIVNTVLSKNQIKFIKSLKDKTCRVENSLFVAEGSKLVGDLIRQNYPIEKVYCTDKFIASMSNFLDNVPFERVTSDQLERTTQLKSVPDVIAMCRIPKIEFDFPSIFQHLCLALDRIQDPGNLGTIIRLADWFGIQHIFCSQDTVDLYNPKTVQATMGAFARVNVHYVDLINLLQTAKKHDVVIYGTFLEGENLYKSQLSPKGIIVMGNEGGGISKPVEELISQKITIPPYPIGETKTESLNVAIATSIICAEFRRQHQGKV